MGETYYEWEYGDGSGDNGLGMGMVNHTYAKNGEYSVKVSVFDKEHHLIASSVRNLAIQLKEQPVLFTIQAPSNTGTTLAGIAFKGVPTTQWPQNIEWIWDWGDGSSPQSSTSSPNYSHRFIKPGKYTVTLAVRDRTTQTQLGTASLNITIDDLYLLHTMSLLTFNVWGYYIEEYGSMKDGVFTHLGFFNAYTSKGGGNTISWPLIWEGYNCHSDLEEKLPGGQTRTWHLQATLSSDTMTVLTASISIDYLDPNYQGTGKYWKQHSKITIKDVPLTGNRATTNVWGKVEGDKAPNSFVSYEYESILQDGYKLQGDKVDRFVKFDWNNTSGGIPKVECTFKTQ
jgi:PKD repeat protein